MYEEVCPSTKHRSPLEGLCMQKHVSTFLNQTSLSPRRVVYAEASLSTSLGQTSHFQRRATKCSTHHTLCSFCSRKSFAHWELDGVDVCAVGGALVSMNSVAQLGPCDCALASAARYSAAQFPVAARSATAGAETGNGHVMPWLEI